MNYTQQNFKLNGGIIMKNEKDILNQLFDKIEEGRVFEDDGFEYKKENGVLYSRQDEKEDWEVEDWEGYTSEYDNYKELFESFLEEDDEEDDDEEMFEVGEELKLDDIGEGIENLGIEYIFSDYNVFDLEIGKHDVTLKGSFSIPIEGTDDYKNICFETVGDYGVINNMHGNVYKTIIDRDSITVKITNIEII
jgi:hypothetical protein